MYATIWQISKEDGKVNTFMCARVDPRVVRYSRGCPLQYAKTYNT
jgi:hypothetical protein